MSATLPPMPDARRAPSGLARIVGGRALVRVRGASMEPTLRDGDLLVVRVHVSFEPQMARCRATARTPRTVGEASRSAGCRRVVGRARQPS